jgi:hypothetical protein
MQADTFDQDVKDLATKLSSLDPYVLLQPQSEQKPDNLAFRLEAHAAINQYFDVGDLHSMSSDWANLIWCVGKCDV